jgi:hypothetical protein
VNTLAQDVEGGASGATMPWMQRAGIAFERARRWEFWPAWLFYIPVVIYILWLGLRFRSPTAFTAANPVFGEGGGVVGESKALPLTALAQRAPDLVAAFALLPEAQMPSTRLLRARRFVSQVGGYPVVLKPDIGQRGRGVSIIRDEAALQAYLAGAQGDVLIQRYIGGEEFGVFIYRKAGGGRDVVYSVTHKCFPEVLGDGRRSLAELIQDHERARLISPLLWRRFAARLDEIPASGTRVPLVEIGAHCRGSLFLDANGLKAPGLEQAMSRVFDAIPGFHFGRLDLRCPSAAHLSHGRDLQVLEVNGVTAEAAHIYHPGTPLWRGYASILRQWRIAFEIGAINARRGAEVTRPFELLRLFREDLRRGKRWG